MEQFFCFVLFYHLLSSHSLIVKTSIHSVNVSTMTAAAAKSLQSCPILCDPIDSSPPGSAIPSRY